MTDMPMSSAATDTRETHSLISSHKVEGTAVRRPNGDKIGEIERVMIDKRSSLAHFRPMQSSSGGTIGPRLRFCRG